LAVVVIVDNDTDVDDGHAVDVMLLFMLRLVHCIAPDDDVCVEIVIFIPPLTLAVNGNVAILVLSQ
jgi:hypothetical protein